MKLVEMLEQLPRLTEQIHIQKYRREAYQQRNR